MGSYLGLGFVCFDIGLYHLVMIFAFTLFFGLLKNFLRNTSFQGERQLSVDGLRIDVTEIIVLPTTEYRLQFYHLPGHQDSLISS